MFADTIQSKITKTSSVLCAGFDPDLRWLPSFAIESAAKSLDQEGYLYTALLTTYSAALEVLEPRVACVKPNAAFFEQYGIGGYRALHQISQLCKKIGVPVILDAKRGDIASSAQAYANAYLEPLEVNGSAVDIVHADAITINPFLGFETIAPFINSCIAKGKGVFVLVKTSNSGSRDIQDLLIEDSAESVSKKIARAINVEGLRAIGKSGLSSIGAVIGATHPAEAAELRSLMPQAIFLVPGFGAQGGSASEALAGQIAPGKGVIVNMSRGLFQIDPHLTRVDWLTELANRADAANAQLASA
jgi:orotidine-5'-phosphate decarboxylase